MIIDTILNKCTWSPYGITCPDVQTMRVVHRFMREAILDRHLYVNKVIGFQLSKSSISRGHAGTYIARHPQLCESYSEVMLSLSNKVFLSDVNGDILVDMNAGDNEVPKLMFVNEKQDFVKVLYEDPHVCRVVDKMCTLRLRTVYDCGYRSCQQNSKKVGQDFFPCCTDFSVGEFFRVLPPEPSGSTVSMRVYNGATWDDLRTLLQLYLKAIQEGSVRKEEREWLRSFML